MQFMVKINIANKPVPTAKKYEVTNPPCVLMGTTIQALSFVSSPVPCSETNIGRDNNEIIIIYYPVYVY